MPGQKKKRIKATRKLLEKHLHENSSLTEEEFEKATTMVETELPGIIDHIRTQIKLLEEKITALQTKVKKTAQERDRMRDEDDERIENQTGDIEGRSLE